MYHLNRNMMKRNLFITALLAISIVSVAQPQPPLEVKPGINGALPTLPAAPSAAEPGRFGALELQLQSMGASFDDYHLFLSFPTAESLGGSYYTLQYKEDNNWVTWSYDGNPYKFEGYNAAPEFCGTFRLVMHGGDMDGYISNEVDVEYPRISNCFVQSTGYNNLHAMEAYGVATMAPSVCVVRYGYPKTGEDTEFGPDSEYYVYEWYRRNPNSYEMTRIAGANSNEYTPTLEDVGYELISTVRGDDQMLSFISSVCKGLVVLPIRSAPSYIGNDGFVLNTEYSLPSPEKDILLNNWTDTITPEEGSVKTRAAGQYAFYMDAEKFDGSELLYKDPRYRISFVYQMPEWDDDGNIIATKPQLREAQLMSEIYRAQLIVKPQLNGSTVNTTIDLVTKNIDDEWSVTESLPIEADAESVTFDAAPVTGCYVKAQKTASTAATYYDNALLWEEAKMVKPGMDEEWNPLTFTINVQPLPTPATQGTGTIEGQVNYIGDKASTRSETPTITVYLKESSDGGSIIATAETDANGNYKFSNIPLGSYQVLVNIDGCKMAAVYSVALTSDNPSATHIDYVVESNKISKAGEAGKAGDANGNGTVDNDDILEVANYIMGNPSAQFNTANADANSDKIVDAADIVTIVNIIKGQ